MRCQTIPFPIILSGLLLFTSCIKKEVSPTPEPETPSTPAYTIPTTYDFGDNLSFTNSTQRVAMMKELINYVKSTHTATANVSIDATKMKGMFSNTGSFFADAGLNTSGIDLKSKTNSVQGIPTEFDALFSELATLSQGTATAQDGIAGKLLGPAPTSTTGTQAAYMVNSAGFEYKELVEKGLMGALLYSEATSILNAISSYDNNNTISGQGTAMEHAWDEGFGYFAVPVTFPTSTINLSFWGSYCNAVNTALGSNATIMNAWLKGRAAISNKDYTTRDTQKEIILNTWEKIAAARCINYLKQAKTNFANDALRNHALSEAVGFVKGFKYNSARKISDADIAELISYFGNSLYQVSLTNMDKAINKLAAVFSLDSSKL